MNFQHAHKQAGVVPVVSVTEPGMQPGRRSDSIQQSGGRAEHVVQDNARPRRTDHSVYVNRTEIQRSVQKQNYPPVSPCTVGGEYFKPPAEAEDSFGRTESHRHQEPTPVDEDNSRRSVVCREGDLTIVQSSAMTDEASVAASIKDNESVVIVQTSVVSTAGHDVDTTVRNAASQPLLDSVYERRTSDARRRESVDRSLHDMQHSFASSISHGEVVADIHDTSEWSDIDTVAEDAADVLVYDSISGRRISDARRRESADKSLYPTQSSFAASVSNGEVIVGTRGTVDSLEETEDPSFVLHAINSAPSKVVDEPAINHGTCWLLNILLHLIFV